MPVLVWNKLFKFIPHNSTTAGPDEKINATAKALDMSLQYSFVTPLTSMVVIKPEVEEGTSSPLIANKLTEGKNKSRTSFFPQAPTLLQSTP